MHDAVKQAMLDPTLPYAIAFIDWFKDLYEIPQRGADPASRSPRTRTAR